MKNLIGRIAKLPDGTKVRIEKLEDTPRGTIAHARRIEGPNKDIRAYVDLTKLEMNLDTGYRIRAIKGVTRG
jgi:uncharacterized LabA/DUF88 family protein